MVLGFGEGGVDGFGARAAEDFAAIEAGLDGEAWKDVLGDGGGDVAEFVEGHSVEGDIEFEGSADGLADEVVGLAEGDVLLDEVIGEVGGVGVATFGGLSADIGADLEGAHDDWGDAEREAQRVHGVEERLFVLLEVFVVREGETLDGGQEGNERSDGAGGLASHEFGGVGVLLLGHERRAGGDLVAEDEEVELLRAVEDEVFAEAGDVGCGDGDRGEGFEDEVSVGDGVEAVCGGGGEVEVLGEGIAVDGVGRSGEGSGAERAEVDAGAGVSEAGGVTGEHGLVGEGPVGEEEGLGALEVGVAGDDGGALAGGEVEERGAGGLEFGDASVDGVACPEAEVGGDLVVSAAACVEFLGERAQGFGESALDEGVDVLVLGESIAEGELGVLVDGGAHGEEGVSEAEVLVVGEDVGAGEGVCPGDGAIDVVECEARVEVERVVDLAEDGVGTCFESSTPEGHGSTFVSERGE